MLLFLIQRFLLMAISDRNKHGGGIALYIRDNFPATLCSQFISIGLESLWVKVHLKPVLIGCCYRPPGTDVQYMNDLCVLIEKSY